MDEGGELPDFFGGDRSAPAEGAGAAEDDELNSLTFGDGFDVPLAGLPEFFSMLGDAPAAISAAAAAEDDDLAAITGAATTTDWSTNAAKFADLQAQYLRDMQLKRAAAAQSAADQLGVDQVLSSLGSLGLEDDDDEETGEGDGVAQEEPFMIAAEDLEAQMIAEATAAAAATTAAPPSAVSSKSGVPAAVRVTLAAPQSAVSAVPPPGPAADLIAVLYDSYGQRATPPVGWVSGDAPPPGHFVAYEEKEAPPAAATTAAVAAVAHVNAAPPLAGDTVQAPPPAQQQQPQQLVSLQTAQTTMPPPHSSNNSTVVVPAPVFQPQQQQPQSAAAQGGSIAGFVATMPAGGSSIPPQLAQMLLTPQVVAGLQLQMQRTMVMATHTPGGLAALPLNVRMQALQAQAMLNQHAAAVAAIQQLQQQQMLRQFQGQQHQQPSGPATLGGASNVPPLPSATAGAPIGGALQSGGPPKPAPTPSPTTKSAWNGIGAPPLPPGSGPPLPRGPAPPLHVSSPPAKRDGPPRVVLSGPTPAESVRETTTPTKAPRVHTTSTASPGSGSGGGGSGPVIVRIVTRGNQATRLAAAGPAVSAGFFASPSSTAAAGGAAAPRGSGGGAPGDSGRRPYPPQQSQQGNGARFTPFHDRQMGGGGGLAGGGAYAAFLHTAAAAAAAYNSSRGGARGGGATVSSLLSRVLPRSAGGKWMPFREVDLVCRFMYNNIANTADPFSDCYYLYALRAKAAAEAARAMAAAALTVSAEASGSRATEDGAAEGSAPANVLDAAAILSSIGASALAKNTETAANAAAAGGSGSGGPSTAAAAPTATAAAAADGGASGGAASSSAGVDTAVAGAIAALPVASVWSRNVAANLEDLKRIAATRRRNWETHNQVLGRQQTSSIRTPKTVLNLSDSGMSSASDIDSGSNSNTVIGSAAGAADDVTSSAAADGAGVTVNGAVTWLARARIDAALQLVLQLQDAARKLQAHLRAQPPPPPDLLSGLRTDVQYLREQLAETVGLRRSDAEEAGEATAAPGTAGAVDDDTMVLLLSLPKGKRLLARAVPMLLPIDRVAAVAAGMRHLPYVVASAVVGADAEEADAALAAFLGRLVRNVIAPAPAAPPARSEDETPQELHAAAASAATVASLEMLNVFLDELNKNHAGAIVRALLQHPGASEVISNLLFRGEHEAGAAESVPAAAAATAKWRATTESLGRAFVEAS